MIMVFDHKLTEVRIMLLEAEPMSLVVVFAARPEGLDFDWERGSQSTVLRSFVLT